MLGLFALQHNGVAHSSSFSALMATTRNPTLDIVSEGHSLGAQPIKDMGRVKLRFGEVDAGQATPHVAWGLDEEVRRLRVGDRYT